MDPFASPDQFDPEFRSFLQKSCDKLSNWFAETGNNSPLPPLKEIIEVAPNLVGLSNYQLLDDVQKIMDCSYRPSHPGALAHLDPPPLTSSIVADLVCAGLNNNLLANELSPVLSQLEQSLCKWIANRLGMPASSGGVLASGGTLSNLMALVIARKNAGLQGDPNAVILVSSDAHISLLKAIRVMGLSDYSLRKVSIDFQGKMSINSLSHQLIKLRSEGKKCFALVATAGTTIRGAIDPLPEIATFCRKENIWFHIDGAIGGVFGLSVTTASLVDGISLAQSVSINPQKLLGVAKTSSLLLVSKKSDLKSTFGTNMPYLEPLTGDDSHGGEIGLQGTRSADVLKLWLGIRQLGENGLQLLLEKSISRRVYIEKLLDSSKFNVISGPLHLIALSPLNVGLSDSSSWSINTRKRLLEEKFMLSRPLYNGRYFLKIVLGNPHTQSSHLQKLSTLLNESYS